MVQRVNTLVKYAAIMGTKYQDSSPCTHLACRVQVISMYLEVEWKTV